MARLHSLMPLALFSSLIVLSACGDAGSGGLEGSGTGESGTEMGESGEAMGESGEGPDTGEGPTCVPYTGGFPATSSVALAGFPLDDDPYYETITYEDSCQLSAFELVDGELVLGLECTHPDAGATELPTVEIRVQADAAPPGLELDETVTFKAREGTHEYGSYASYTVTDDEGLVFGANLHSLGGSYGDIEVTAFANCDEWTPCSGSDTLTGAIRVTLDDEQVDVYPPTPRSITRGDQSWTITIDNARFDGSDCHSGPTGRFSILREPA